MQNAPHDGTYIIIQTDFGWVIGHWNNGWKMKNDPYHAINALSWMPLKGKIYE